MEYPGSILHRPLRYVILGVFITAFLTISPLLLLYTVGYRYDWKNGLIRTIGTLNINTEPKTARAFLNNVALKNEMPLTQNIKPGTYQLRLSAPGYHDFNKEITINVKQTLYLEHLELLKKSVPEQITKLAADRIELSHNGKYLLYFSHTNPKILSLLNFNTKKTSFITNLNQTDASHLDIQWSAQDTYFSIFDPTSSTLRVFDTQRGEEITLPLTTTSAIQKMQWKNSSDPIFYYSTADRIYSYPILTNETTLVNEEPTKDWGFGDNTLWLLDFTTSTKQFSVRNKGLIFDNNSYTFDKGIIINNIAHIYKKTIALKTNNGFSIINDNKKFDIPGDHFIEVGDNEWFFWNSHEIWTYTKGEVKLLYRSADTINQLVSLSGGSLLGLIINNDFQVFYPDQLLFYPLLTKTMKNIAVDTEERFIYFIDTTDNNIVSKLAY